MSSFFASLFDAHISAVISSPSPSECSVADLVVVFKAKSLFQVGCSENGVGV